MPINTALNQFTDLIASDGLFEGQRANSEDVTILTGFNYSANILIPGRAVVADPSNDRGLIYPVDANSIFKGILTEPLGVEKRDGYSVTSEGLFGWPAYSEVAYMIRGVVGVKITQAMTENDPIYWIHTPATGELDGQFRKDANTNKAVLLPSARLRRRGVAGQVRPLGINIV